MPFWGWEMRVGGWEMPFLGLGNAVVGRLARTEVVARRAVPVAAGGGPVPGLGAALVVQRQRRRLPEFRLRRLRRQRQQLPRRAGVPGCLR